VCSSRPSAPETAAQRRLPLIAIKQRGDMLDCMLLKGTSCVQLKAFFPRDGSTETPPHPSADFNWKDYCPTAFGKLREVFNIEAAEYMKSICGKLISQLCLCPRSSYSCAQFCIRPAYASAMDALMLLGGHTVPLLRPMHIPQ